MSYGHLEASKKRRKAQLAQAVDDKRNNFYTNMQQQTGIFPAGECEPFSLHPSKAATRRVHVI